jgi:Concanavalin A-like lectin/glucanases superfamily
MQNAATDCYTLMRLDADAYAQTDADIGIALDGSASFSIDFWIKLDGLASNAALFSKKGVISVGSDGDTVVFAIHGYPSVYSDPKKQPLDDKLWHYVCVTYAGGSVRIYIDGEFNCLQGISGSCLTNSNPCLIGSSVEGYVKSVRIYNKALGADDVLNYMYGTPAMADIVADFDFTVNPPVDHGPGKHPIELKESAIMITQYPALALGGTAYAKPLRDEDVNPGGSQVDPYTVQTEVYISSSTVERQALFVNSDLERETGMALFLVYDESASAFRVESQRGSGSTSADSLVSTGFVQKNAWTNVATTFDGVKLVIYINGELDSSQDAAPIPLMQDESNLLIGAALRHGLPSGAYSLQGFVQRVDVWSKALTDAEVAQYRDSRPDLLSDNLESAYDFTERPARDRVDGFSVGLADGARMTYLNLPAKSSTPEDILAVVQQALSDQERIEQLDSATLKELRSSISFGDFIEKNTSFFDKGLDADLAYGARHFEQEQFGDYKEKLTAAWRDVRHKAEHSPLELRMNVTRHLIGNEHVLVLHTPQESRVVFRADKDSIDPCTLWKVQLVFVIIGGILDALFGISSSLVTKATTFIVNRVLTVPGIMAALAVGSAMSASSIFGIGKAMYKHGLLVALIKLIIDVGIWTVFRICAKAVLTFLGVGAADIIASLVATALIFAKTYLERPATCDPLPKVDIAAIKFNHDPTSRAVDAINIRKNSTEEVDAPEWISGRAKPEESPAAYSMKECTGKVVTVEVKFTINTKDDTQATIQAIDGGILGKIDPVMVLFKNGVSDPEFVSIPLNHHGIGAGGVLKEDIQWKWQYQEPGGSWSDMGTTPHRIYAVLDNPKSPWKQTGYPKNNQLPWTDVLDYACEWAKGSTDEDQVNAAITAKINNGIRLTYDTAHGDSSYVALIGVSQSFLCTEFIEYLTTGGGKGNVVNCTDCGTIVTAFVNILGCNVFAARMEANFKLNKVISIGDTVWAIPFAGRGGAFSYHEVAWTGAGSYTDPLYDACLKVDKSDDPWSHPDTSRQAYLPVRMMFTTTSCMIMVLPIIPPFTALSYRERLCKNEIDGINSCAPTGSWPNSNGGRRRVT